MANGNALAQIIRGALGGTAIERERQQAEQLRQQEAADAFRRAIEMELFRSGLREEANVASEGRAEAADLRTEERERGQKASDLQSALLSAFPKRSARAGVAETDDLGALSGLQARFGRTEERQTERRERRQDESKAILADLRKLQSSGLLTEDFVSRASGMKLPELRALQSEAQVQAGVRNRSIMDQRLAAEAALAGGRTGRNQFIGVSEQIQSLNATRQTIESQLRQLPDESEARRQALRSNPDSVEESLRLNRETRAQLTRDLADVQQQLLTLQSQLLTGQTVDPGLEALGDQFLPQQ